MNLDSDMLDIERDTSIQVLTDPNRQVLQYINSTFRDIIDALRARPYGKIEIKLRRINAINQQISRGQPQTEGREMKYSWPGSTADEAWRFACLVNILSQIRHSILNNTVVTKRDIYYHDPELFKKQETVDRFVDDISYTCGVKRTDLKVTASPKGLLCGTPGLGDVQGVDLASTADYSTLRWIVVVEKEASFNTLVENGFHRQCSLGPGLLVTGKGYPDISTRQLLRHILDTTPNRIPIFGLMDGDPDGIDIYRCYVSGSRRLAQEMAFNIPEMQWLGINLGEFLHMQTVMRQCIPLTDRDRTRARNMLARSSIAGIEGASDAKMRSMLQMMLMLGVKTEIQALDVLPNGGICGWLDRKLQAMS